MSPVPRETMKMSRPKIHDLARTIVQGGSYGSSLASTVAMPPARTPLASTVAMVPARTPLASTVAMAPPRRAPLASTVALARPVAMPAMGPMPAMAPMPACSPTADPRLFMIADPKGAQSAAFRALGDTLVTKGLPRVLGITSPAAKDGKTTCAINLALALAEHRIPRLLLVDLNFNAPAIGGLLGVEETTNDASRAWAAPFTLSVLTPSLHVATLPARPGQYLDFATLARLVASFQRAGYAHILLDMPALEGSPEADLLLQLANGVLLAVRSGRSTSGALRRCVERIGPNKALGVTLIDAQHA